MKISILKLVMVILFCTYSISALWAQTPEKISYQAVIRNSTDQLVIDQSIGMQISILQGSILGTLVYVERHFPTTNANGLVSLEIGTGILVSGSFTNIDWANDIYFIKTETDLNGGASYTITGTSQLLSVPYALHAKTAEIITGTVTETDPIFTAWDKSSGISITESQISDLGTYIETETDPSVLQGTQTGEMQYWNGTAWVTVVAGLNGQILRYKNGVPTWTDGNINDLSIGDSYQGGIIAYFLVLGDPGYDANVKHGLIAATADQSTGIQWWNGSYSITGATAEEIGTGSANTTTIINSQGPIATSYAAGLARAYNGGDYSDWYLPSKDELNKLYLNRVVIGGFTSAQYWSSSEMSSSQTWIQIFASGSQGTGDKAFPRYVRAIRAF